MFSLSVLSPKTVYLKLGLGWGKIDTLGLFSKLEDSVKRTNSSMVFIVCVKHSDFVLLRTLTPKYVYTAGTPSTPSTILVGVRHMDSALDCLTWLKVLWLTNYTTGVTSNPC